MGESDDITIDKALDELFYAVSGADVESVRTAFIKFIGCMDGRASYTSNTIELSVADINRVIAWIKEG